MVGGQAKKQGDKNIKKRPAKATRENKFIVEQIKAWPDDIRNTNAFQSFFHVGNVVKALSKTVRRKKTIARNEEKSWDAVAWKHLE